MDERSCSGAGTSMRPQTYGPPRGHEAWANSLQGLADAAIVILAQHNEKIRNVIDTIGRKGVLLLGRFTEGRMIVLERLRDRLRSLGYVPMVFNFDKPETKDFTETVRLLANLSHFVIVDITNPRSRPLSCRRPCRTTWSRSSRFWSKGKTPLRCS